MRKSALTAHVLGKLRLVILALIVDWVLCHYGRQEVLVCISSQLEFKGEHLLLGLVLILPTLAVNWLAGRFSRLLPTISFLGAATTERDIWREPLWKLAIRSFSDGLGEEFCYRGPVQAVFGLWLPALWFGIRHGQTWGDYRKMAWTGLLGLWLGVIVVISGSLWPAVIAHAGNNCFAFWWLLQHPYRRSELDAVGEGLAAACRTGVSGKS
jgi:hypothetical protein